MLIIKSIRKAAIKRLKEKAKRMAANGSNCSDVLTRIKAIESSVVDGNGVWRKDGYRL